MQTLEALFYYPYRHKADRLSVAALVIVEVFIPIREGIPVRVDASINSSTSALSNLHFSLSFFRPGTQFSTLTLSNIHFFYR